MTRTSGTASSSGISTAAALAGIKRPRSGAAAAAPSAALPASDDSGDHAKDSTARKGGGGGGNSNGGDKEAECTPEGLLMAHALDALTPRQRAQFEAYRNAVFPADAVAAYVSHRLCHNEEKRYVRRHGTAGVLGGGRGGEGGGSGLGVVPHSGWGEVALRRCPYVDHAESSASTTATSTCSSTASASATSPTTVAAPPLRDMVAPETEQEITAVVSALAKLHAQRLVAAARRLATAEGHPQNEPLRPYHVVQAKRYRTQAGLDPGFFMGIGGDGGGRIAAGGASGGGGGAAAAAALDVVDVHRLKMEAAFEAQRKYDGQFGHDD